LIQPRITRILADRRSNSRAALGNRRQLFEKPNQSPKKTTGSRVALSLECGVVTLRAYGNAVEAALAKTLLDDRGIPCRLADEGSHLYGGAPLAMPIRILVPEERLEEASRVLDDAAKSLPDDFEPAGAANISSTPVDIDRQLLSEVRELRQRSWWNTLLAGVLLILTVYLISELPRRIASPWTEVSRAMRGYDYRRALSLAKAIAAQHRNDYYAHEYLGDVYVAIGDLANAESEYARAYELAPPQVLQRKLSDVRRRRGTEPTPAPTLSPWP
jgi:tetratricopeptide (TPR) repeat protein